MENLDKLIDLLNQQKDIYLDLLDISKKKTEVIIEANVAELENITKIEQVLILKMGKLEESFDTILKDMKLQLSIEDDKVNMSSIIDLLEEPDKNKLDSIRNDMFNIIKELEKTNKHNSGLIKNSLDYIDFSINLFSNSNSVSSTGYANSGDIQVNKRSFFDKKL